MHNAVRIERAAPEDGPAMLALLAGHALPADDLLAHLDTALVARLDDRIVGCAALEVYPDGALLRSVAVDPALVGQGIGGELTACAVDLATRLRVPAVYLLTTTAEAFFPRFAFERIARADVPGSVQASVEFRGACPSSAIVMRRTL